MLMLIVFSPTHPLILQVNPSSIVELATAHPKNGAQGAIVTVSLLEVIYNHDPVHSDAISLIFVTIRPAHHQNPVLCTEI